MPKIHIKTDVIALFFLGISSGLPILLVFGSLSAWMREADIERATIGFLSWAGMSYGFKFIWAPLIDHLRLPFLHNYLGRRRSWLVLSQLFILLALVWMSLMDPFGSSIGLVGLAVGAVLLGFSSATQDIVIDAYRIDISTSERQALLSGIAVAGYRVGMVFAGAGVLEISELLGSNADHYLASAWQVAYLAMAVLMLIGLVTTFLIQEPNSSLRKIQADVSPVRLVIHFLCCVSVFIVTFISFDRLVSGPSALPALLVFMIESLHMLLSLFFAIVTGWFLCKLQLLKSSDFKHIYIRPFTDFFARYGKLALWLILIICFYRTADIVMGVMAKVFYIDMGYSKSQIARISVTFGLLVSLSGGILGGLMALRWGLIKILMLGAVTSAVTNLFFIYLAGLSEPSDLMLIVAVLGDNLAGGIAGGVAVAFISSLVSKEFSATQYAAFSSITVMLPKLLAGYSGQIVDAAGYEGFFAITAGLGLPVVLLILVIWRPYQRLSKMNI